MSTAQDPPQIQTALRHGPGRFRSSLTFHLLSGTSAQMGRERLALLLKEIESPELEGKPLKILVGVAPRLLESHPAWKQLEPEYVRHGELHEEQASAFVQIAAETEDERTYALRLVRRVLSDAYRLAEQIHGVQRALGTEAFGYRHQTQWEEEIVVPTSSASPGASWLLYQPCVQNLAEFFAQTPERQDAIIGRGRTEQDEHAGAPGSHMALGHAAQERNRSGLLRRSFAYECYEEAGLVFVGSASHSEHLVRALAALEKDPLMPFMELRNGGVFVLPPSSEWLAPGVELCALTGEARPPAEQIFYPEHPLVLYEVTPKSREFFYRLFHDNKEHIDDETNQLRTDLQLMAKLLAKLLFGARLGPENRFRKLCEIVSIWDTSDPLSEAAAQLSEKVARALLDGRDGLEVAHMSLPLKAALLPRAVVKAGPFANITISDLIADIMYDDALYMAGSSEQRRRQFAELPALWKEAASEARALNTFAGGYMTFVP